MIKSVKFLRDNVSREDFVKESCSMLNDIFKRTDNGFEELNKHGAEFSALVDAVITNIYASGYDILDCSEAIVDVCYSFDCNTGINVLYLISSMLDRVRVKKGIDFRKVTCVNALCRAMESMGFIVNPTEYNSGVDTFSFSKDSSISNDYLLQCSFNRCFENWVEFRKKFKVEFSKYQSELASTPLSLWR